MTGTEGNEMGVNDMSDTRNRGLTEANGRILMFAVSMSPLVSLVCLTLTSHSSYSRSPSSGSSCLHSSSHLPSGRHEGTEWSEPEARVVNDMR